MISRISSGGGVTRRTAEVWGKFVPKLRGRNTKRGICFLEIGDGGRAKNGEAG
jgi:hypothetical protein